MNDVAIIRQQRERIDELEEIIRQLRKSDQIAELFFPVEWRLTPSQSVILRALYRSPHGRATYDQIDDALDMARFRKEKHDAGRDNLSVLTFRMRKALKPYGIEIQTIWGFGYALPAASRQIIREAINAQVAA